MNINFIQRAIYIFNLIIVIVIKFLWGTSPKSIKDWFLFGLIIIPIIYQIIFNNKIGWIILICLTVVHMIFAFINVVESGLLSQIPIFLVIYIILHRTPWPISLL
jgi:hypothetical protein